MNKSKRLSLTLNDNIRYQLKTPYRESLPRERNECCGHGATHVIFALLDFIARAGSAGAPAASQYDPLSRYVCAQQPASIR